MESYETLWADILVALEQGETQNAYTKLYEKLQQLIQAASNFDVLYEQVWDLCRGLNRMQTAQRSEACYEHFLGMLQELIGEGNLIFFNVLYNSVEPLIQQEDWKRAEERMDFVVHQFQQLAGTEEEIIDPGIHGKLAEIVAEQEDWKYVIYLQERIIAVLQEEEEVDGFEVGRRYYQLGLAHQMDGQQPDSALPLQESIRLLAPFRDETRGRELYATALSIYAPLLEDQPVRCKQICEQAIDYQLKAGIAPSILYGHIQALLGQSLLALEAPQRAREALEEGLFWISQEGEEGIGDYLAARQLLGDLLTRHTPSLSVWEALQIRWPAVAFAHAWEAHTKARLEQEENRLQEAYHWAKKGLSLYLQLEHLPWKPYEDLFFIPYYTVCQELGYREEAFQEYEKLLSLAEGRFGEKDLALIPYLIDLCLEAQDLYGNQHAYPYCNRLIPLLEQQNEYPSTLGFCYLMRGVELVEQAAFDQAIKWYDKAVPLINQHEGSETELANLRTMQYMGQGACYLNFDQRQESIRAYDQALLNAEKRTLKDQTYFCCYAAAGMLQFLEQNWDRAEQLLQVCMKEKSLWWAEGYPDLALVKFMWAWLMGLQDNNAEAEFYFDQYLAELPAELVEMKGYLLSRQGLVYEDLGRHEKTIEMQEAALELFAQHQPEDVHSQLLAMRSMGHAYVALRKKKEAILNSKKAISLAMRAYGETDLRTLDLEVDLAGIYNIFFDHFASLRILGKSLRYFDAHPEQKQSHVYGMTLGLAISTCSSLGDHVKAQHFAQVFSQIKEQNPLVQEALEMGITAGAIKHIAQDMKGGAAAIIKGIEPVLAELETNFGYLTESEKVTYLQKLRFQFFIFLIYLMNAYDKGAIDDLAEALQLWLRIKGLVLHSQSSMMAQVSEQADNETQKRLEEWRQLRAQRIDQFESPEALPPKEVEVLSQRLAQVEKTLNFSQRGNQVLPTVELSALRHSLAPHEVALEFIAMTPVMGIEEKVQDKFFAVLLLLPDQEKVLFQEIAHGNEIEQTIRQLALARTQETHEQIAEKLWTYLWKPLAYRLAAYSKIYLSVDGMLHHCNFNLLCNPTTKSLLMDEKELVFLTSLRSLAGRQEDTRTFPQRSLLFGAPDYDPPGSAKWTPLPGTKEETDQIARLLGAEQLSYHLFQGKEAHKDQLFAHPSPGMLHFATHGYFSPPDFMDERESELDEIVEFNPFQERGGKSAETKQHEDAMFRAGIVLAGANTSKEGILTAFEITQLDLSKTQLVVLSGCETGLGAVAEGEGIFGLQRAFFAAGAQAIIMSLWAVPDEPTMRLFQLFYQAWLKSGNKYEAFRKAQQSVRRAYPNPRNWGGFILVEA